MTDRVKKYCKLYLKTFSCSFSKDDIFVMQVCKKSNKKKIDKKNHYLREIKKNTKVKVHSSDRDSDYFDIVAGVL